jgi:hypothetical protein
MAHPVWVTTLRTVLLTGTAVLLILSAELVWLGLGTFRPHSALAPRLGFILGLLWIALFGWMVNHGLQTVGGVGFDRKTLLGVGIIAIESGILAFPAFGSWWRLLGLLPVLLAAYTLQVWVLAFR